MRRTLLSEKNARLELVTLYCQKCIKLHRKCPGRYTVVLMGLLRWISISDNSETMWQTNPGNKGQKKQKTGRKDDRGMGKALTKSILGKGNGYLEY